VKTYELVQALTSFESRVGDFCEMRFVIRFKVRSGGFDLYLCQLQVILGELMVIYQGKEGDVPFFYVLLVNGLKEMMGYGGLLVVWAL
jgi:hypothetical protein